MYEDILLEGLEDECEEHFKMFNICKAETIRHTIKTSVYTAKDARRLHKGEKVYVANSISEMIDTVVKKEDPSILEDVLDESYGKCFVVDGVAYTYACVVEPYVVDQVCTHRQLARWLAKGKGEYRYVDTSGIPYDAVGSMSTTDYHHGDVDENEPVTNIEVRSWNDDEWHAPTVNYIHLDTLYPRMLMGLYKACETM